LVIFFKGKKGRQRQGSRGESSKEGRCSGRPDVSCFTEKNSEEKCRRERIKILLVLQGRNVREKKKEKCWGEKLLIGQLKKKKTGLPNY